MAAQTKLIILRSHLSVPNDNLELFIGHSGEGEVHIIDMNMQLNWLNLIADNVRNSRKKND